MAFGAAFLLILLITGLTGREALASNSAIEQQSRDRIQGWMGLHNYMNKRAHLGHMARLGQAPEKHKGKLFTIKVEKIIIIKFT